MNVVYKITFLERLKNNCYPYYYIGSKTNCKIIDGQIIDKRNKPYFGSSKYKNYKQIVDEHKNSINIEILFESKSIKQILQFEHDIHIKYNVLMSPEYFNQSIATINNFNDPNYTVMRNVISNKICRVYKYHPDIKKGLWVGITKGRKWYNNGIESKQFIEPPTGWNLGRILDIKGNKNPFFGKKHKKKTLMRMVQTRINKKSYNAWNKGKSGHFSHSEKSKLKMSKHRKGKGKGKMNPMYGKKWINNGIENMLISKHDKLPNDWKYGQLKNRVK